MTNKSGTVGYHRADYDPEAIMPWLVQFTPGGKAVGFTATDGKAMGLTPPEPAPLVVTCNGHSIELSDDDDAGFSEVVLRMPMMQSPYGRTAHALGRLLRDARQDPQPASDDTVTFNAGESVVRNCVIHAGATVAFDPDGRAHIKPAPLSPGECLRGLLAGRTDADELIELAASAWGYAGMTAHSRLRAAVGDAARELHG